jgi:hypothetical protein
LIKRAKLGRPPVSAADIKGILRTLIQTNPAAFGPIIKGVIGTTERFQDDEFNKKISDYNANQGDQAFEAIFTFISPGLDEAINRRRHKAEDILRRSGYKIQALSNSTYQVQDLEDQDTYQVSIPNETCTCLDWQRVSKISLWCKHLYGCSSSQQGLPSID